ncbi:MAG TPA: hypothetical protein ENK50_11305, partial [Sedimenticola sp.]|nr:hypothetical protein [Sedimenticola sp.]
MNDRLPLFQFTSTVSLILLSWFLAGYYGGAPQGFPAAGDLLIPLLWSLLFISLRGTCCIGLAIAVYTLFLLMLLADRLNFGGSSLSSQITYLFLSWSLGSGFLLLQQLFSETRPRITYSFLLLLLAGACVLPVVYIVYALGFDTAVTRETIYAILQSNLDEAIEFCRDQLSSLWFVSALGLCIFLGILLLQQGKGKSLP